jgi:crotonobetainyl-CoA:carnitine CoA-transferase CaiB-like acyl-CoA transferase|tara:strand:+ start:29588 stop:31978 length:2391 start_codon:yes stop_codon:yes gene_type:complete
MKDLRILEYSTSVAAAWCGQQFAHWGADVILVEDSSGSPLRSRSPNMVREGASYSLLWENLHRGKRLVELEPVSELWQSADLIITDRSLQALGVDAAGDAIVVHITPYGLSGPHRDRAATELTIEATSGFLSLNGSPDKAPLRAPGNLIGYYCGVNAFVGALAALHKRQLTGQGETVEVSWLESVVSMVPFVRAQYTGEAEERLGGPSSGVRLYPVGDGFISLNLLPDRAFAGLLELLGLDVDDIPEDVSTADKRRDHSAVTRFLKERTEGISARELFKQINSSSMQPTGLLNTPAQVLGDEHLMDIHYFREISHTQLGTVSVSGSPAKVFPLGEIGEPAGATRVSPAPGIPLASDGEPQPRWRKELQRSGDKETLRDMSDRPLEGIRIVDLTQAWIGPFATQLLADLGADVIKIESHKRPDVWRRARSPAEQAAVTNENAHPINVGGRFNGANRNKRGLCLDLNTPRGRSLVLELIKDADIIIENFTPRVMRKFGLHDDVLKGVNPNIISVSFSGYGRNGPYASFKANGTTIEALAGWDSLFREPADRPMVMGFYQADAITGIHLVAATLVALLQRDMTGGGKSVEGSMLEAAVSYIGELVLQVSLGEDVVAYGNRQPDMAPQGVFPCKGDDRWIALTVRDDRDWQAFKSVIQLETERYDLLAERMQQAEQLEAIISAWTDQQPAEQIVARLQELDIPAAVVNDTLTVLTDEQLSDRNWFNPMVHPDTGTHLYAGFPWRFSSCELSVDRPAPRLGEHSIEILSDELSLSAEQIQDLFDEGITDMVLEKPADSMDA